MKGLKLFLLFSLSMVLLCGNIHAMKEKLVEIKTRGKIDQRYILIQPENPTAVVILFAGGHGGLDLFKYLNGKPGMKWGKNNFVVRTRMSFANNGFVVAVIDSPPDQSKMDAIWRMGKEHAEDIKAVIQNIKKDYDLPVWLVGTSLGTFSVPNAAIRIGSEVNGLVLTSSVTRSRKKWEIYKTYPNGIIDMDLEKIKVPSLIVSHKEDGCDVTPPEDAEKLKNAFPNSSKVEVVYFSGGKDPKSEPCKALSQHGYYGIEEQVVNEICGFIRDNS